LGLVEPAVAIITALALLLVLLYKRVNLGIVLNAAALLLAFLALDWQSIPTVIYQTTTDLTTISIVLATFVIMLLSQLYKETGLVKKLSESISKIVNKPKASLSLLPAIVGLLPVAGGALTSAPLVDLEAEKLKIKPERKAYINLWFRHTIFPVYPLSQPLIVTAALTGIAMPLIILRQIPVVVVMVVSGYVIAFWKTAKAGSPREGSWSNDSRSLTRDFLVSFSPILTAIAVNLFLNLVWLGSSKQGVDVLFATSVGLVVLIGISRLSFGVFVKPLKSWTIYGITFAAYGAFLLRNTMVAAGISGMFQALVANGSLDVVLLLIIVPATLGVLTGSPLGGVSIAISILAGILTFSPKVAALIYISAYLGYTVAPTHLCFAFTADYFKCSMGKIYRYVAPSFIAAFAAALLVYFFI
jgi:integral membrane protein (TIGR00529 family)